MRQHKRSTVLALLAVLLTVLVTRTTLPAAEITPPKPAKPALPAVPTKPTAPTPPTTPKPATPATPPAPAAAPIAYGPYRWFYVSRSLQKDQDVLDIESLLERAHNHGLNGMVLTGSLDTIDLQNDEYLERLARVKRAADKFNIEIIPILFSVGYGGAVLAHDRNLAEGFEVKDAPFVVKDGVANLVPDTACALSNGSFEDHTGDTVAGLVFQDQPGEISFADTATVHDGKVAIRCENFTKNKFGHGRIVLPLTLIPRRAYVFSCWVKTRDFAPTGAFRLQLITADGATALSDAPKLAATGDWQRVAFLFNSSDLKPVQLYMGAWGGQAGAFWIDGCELHELGINNILRRPGTPLTVVNAADGTAYTEGKDFAPVSDPNLTFLPDHADIPIRLLPGSRIPEGATLKVSWFHGQAVMAHQVSICMSEPKVYAIWAEVAKRIQAALAPNKYLLSMDEIREAGTCQACRDRKLPLSEILGDCISRQEAILREVNPKAEVFCWSDMLDPNHNAHDHYFLCVGDFTGSWKSVPKDLGIACWYFDQRAASLKFFSEQGFRTVAAAYYDGDNLDNIQGWLDAMKGIPNADGICYTTWENKYKLLDAFGDLVKTYSFAAPAVSPATNSR